MDGRLGPVTVLVCALVLGGCGSIKSKDNAYSYLGRVVETVDEAVTEQYSRPDNNPLRWGFGAVGALAYEATKDRIAQGFIPIAEAIGWFAGLSPNDQRDVLRVLVRMTSQATPMKSDVEHAIRQAGLKPTFTPCVMAMKTESPVRGFDKLGNLPPHEWVKTFRLLIGLFSIADQRRRETWCKGGCTHAWHNLANYAH